MTGFNNTYDNNGDKVVNTFKEIFSKNVLTRRSDVIVSRAVPEILEERLLQSGIDATVSHMYHMDCFESFKIADDASYASWMIPSVNAHVNNECFEALAELDLLPVQFRDGDFCEVLIYPTDENIKALVRILSSYDHLRANWYLLRDIVDLTLPTRTGELVFVSDAFDPIEALEVVSGQRNVVDLCEFDADTREWLQSLSTSDDENVDETTEDFFVCWERFVTDEEDQDLEDEFVTDLIDVVAPTPAKGTERLFSILDAFDELFAAINAGKDSDSEVVENIDGDEDIADFESIEDSIIDSYDELDNVVVDDLIFADEAEDQ